MSTNEPKPAAAKITGEAHRERMAAAAKKNAALARRVAAWRRKTFGK